MTDKMREEFEAWASEYGLVDLSRDYENGGYYSHGDTDLAWSAWQASRAALAGKGGAQ